MKSKYLGKKVIVRGDRSGVFYGILNEKQGSEVRLTDCRQLWYWEGAAAINQLALNGTTKPDGCKFTVIVKSLEISDCIEILPCTKEAIKSIESVKTWKL